MKVGSLVFATDQGLGYLAKSFYDAGVVTDVMTVAHGKRLEHPEWYPGAGRINSFRGSGLRDAISFVERMDVMLFFETPFAWELIPYAREKGVRTVLMPMIECMPRILPHLPDVILCPSALDYNWYQSYHNVSPTQCAGGNVQVVHLPVPVEQQFIDGWRERKQALTFVHNAGHGGLKGRNGTKELIEAIRLVRSEAKFIIRCQDNHSWPPYPELLGRVTYTEGTVPAGNLYAEGDVFIFPEKFNGLSLPLQEAYASGMLVMATNRFPMNEWLPNEPLITPDGYDKMSVAPRCNDVMAARIDPVLVAKHIDEWYGRDIAEYSRKGLEWAKANSWEALKAKYMEVLRG